MSGGAGEPERVLTRNEAETEAVGARLAATLHPGAVVLLSGQLGAGKTAFVRGLARGLGMAADEVSSPTFALVHEHRGGRCPLFHVDLYRLTAAAAADLGLEELGVDSGVVAIEWPDRLGQVPLGAIDVRIEHAGTGDDERIIQIAARPSATYAGGSARRPASC